MTQRHRDGVSGDPGVGNAKLQDYVKRSERPIRTFLVSNPTVRNRILWVRPSITVVEGRSPNPCQG